jgi:MoxR-like ATPase
MIYQQGTGSFDFRPGGVFANVVLADEINRGTPKTQSALLEVMAERIVTVDSVPHAVPRPFLVVATQNPIELDGTYRLPEAQLDRFLMKTSIGYPDAASSITVLREARVRDRAASVTPIITGEVVQQMAQLADDVFVADDILAYVTALAETSRQHASLRMGLSVRGCLAYVRCAKTWAAANGRNYVVPDDIKDLALPILEHRLLLDADAQFSGVTVRNIVDEIFSAVPPPVGQVA